MGAQGILKRTNFGVDYSSCYRLKLKSTLSFGLGWEFDNKSKVRLSTIVGAVWGGDYLLSISM